MLRGIRGLEVDPHDPREAPQPGGLAPRELARAQRDELDASLAVELAVDQGQHLGVAQGLGNAFYEELVYDDNGQLVNASFMDFLIPTALDVPRIEVGHEETVSPLNALGTKGAGEAGAIPVGALFAQAVEDALAIPGLEIREIPLKPSRLWELASREHP